MLPNGTPTDLMVVILHTDKLFSYIETKDMIDQTKFPPQVVSTYPVEKPNKNDTTKRE